MGSNRRPGDFILRRGIDTRPIGGVRSPGKSASIAKDLTPETEIRQMFGREPKRNDMLSGAFVKDVRAAGFEVLHAPTTRNPMHVRIVAGSRTFDEQGRTWLSLAFDQIAKVRGGTQ